jgi:hypothetical protein
MRWAGHLAGLSVKEMACRELLRKPEGKDPLRNPRNRYEDNITIDAILIGWVKNQIHVAYLLP